MGDLVCFRREQGARTPSDVWSPVSRIIGFDNKTVWVTCEGVPVATSLQRLRPCSAAELLAHQALTRRPRFDVPPPPARGEQHSYLDARGDAAPRARDPGEGGDEEEAPRVRRRLDEAGHAAPADRPDADGPRPREPRAIDVDRESLSDEPDTEEFPRTPAIQQDLLDSWSRTGTTGAGVDVLRRLSGAQDPSSVAAEPARSSSDAAPSAGFRWEPPDDAALAEFRAFVANRVVTRPGEQWIAKRKTKYTAKRAREAAGKTLNFWKSPPEVQKGLLEARRREWDKWKQFNAARVVHGDELRELVAEGHTPLPMQWIEVDKNAHKRVDGMEVEPLYKSRRVARGDLEDAHVRSDSPTCDVEGQNLIFSFAACHNLPVRSADITNAYFQGQELDRILLFKQPPGGLPDPDLPEDAHLLARVPIYGARDAGRGFWKALRNSPVESGMKENRILRALYSYAENGEVKALLCSHVDDILWACKPETEWLIEKAKKSFVWGKEETRNFRYCGKDVAQSDGGTIRVTCRDSTLRIGRINIAAGRKPSEPVTEAETTQLKSVAGSLSWIARQCRPDLSYCVSRLQARSEGYGSRFEGSEQSP